MNDERAFGEQLQRRRRRTRHPHYREPLAAAPALRAKGHMGPLLGTSGMEKRPGRKDTYSSKGDSNPYKQRPSAHQVLHGSKFVLLPSATLPDMPQHASASSNRTWIDGSSLKKAARIQGPTYDESPRLHTGALTYKLTRFGRKPQKTKNMKSGASSRETAPARAMPFLRRTTPTKGRSTGSLSDPGAPQGRSTEPRAN